MRPTAIVLAVVFGLAAPVVVAAPSVDEALSRFKQEIASDINAMPAYETLADSLAGGGYLGRGDVPRLMELLSGAIDERTQFIAYKMLGLVLYDRGHAEEAHACTEVFQKHSIRIEEALNRAGVLVGGVARKPSGGAIEASQAPTAEERPSAGEPAAAAPTPHTVRLKNGQTLDGEVVEETEQGVWFEALGTRMLLGRDEIESITGR